MARALIDRFPSATSSTLGGIAVGCANIIDEIADLPLSRTGAMLSFQLMSRRYDMPAPW